MLCAIALLGASTLFAVNLTSGPVQGPPTTFPDGNFENPVMIGSPGYQYRPSGTQWTYAGGSGVARNSTAFTSGNPNAPQGTQVLFLQGGGSSIQQTIGLVAGEYQFQFQAAQRGNHQASSQTFELKIDGVSIQSFTPSGTTYESMSSGIVNLSSGTHTIELPILAVQYALHGPGRL